MNPFTKRKFLNFTLEAQHKKCAELLRSYYINTQRSHLAHYNEIQQWMQLPPLESPSREQVSDRFHQHLDKADVHLSEHNLLPRVRRNDSHGTTAEKLEVHTYLDHIRSAHNVGSILRTVEAFQLGDVIFSPDTPGEDHPQVIKTSMGSSEGISCRRHVKVEDLPRPLIALETSPDAIPLDEYNFPACCCLVVGNEEYGISDDMLSHADAIVEIPLYGKKNSLNVANAFAIVAAAVSQKLRSKERYASV